MTSEAITSMILALRRGPYRNGLGCGQPVGASNQRDAPCQAHTDAKMCRGKILNCFECAKLRLYYNRAVLGHPVGCKCPAKPGATSSKRHAKNQAGCASARSIYKNENTWRRPGGKEHSEASGIPTPTLEDAIKAGL